MTGRRRGCLHGLREYVVWGLLGSTAAVAQVRARPMAYAGVDAAGMATTLPAALRSMAAEAGVIFVGTVTGVRRVEGDGFGAVGVVEVRFAVEQGIFGVSGTSYTLREWGGLWPAGDRGLGVGDRRLMLLHSPGVTGLSSPVGGFEGAIPVVGTEARVGMASRATTAAEPMLDLRWIAAKLARPTTVPTMGGGVMRAPVGSVRERAEMVAEDGAEGAERSTRVPTLVHGTLPGIGGLNVVGEAGLSNAPVLEPASEGMESTLPVASVVALLRQWQGSERGAR